MAGGFTGVRGIKRLFNDQAGFLGMLLEIPVQPGVNNAADNAGNFTVAKLGLCLPFKLRLGKLD